MSHAVTTCKRCGATSVLVHAPTDKTGAVVVSYIVCPSCDRRKCSHCGTPDMTSKARVCRHCGHSFSGLA